MQPNRLQMYSLILAFERDLRDMFLQFVATVETEEEALGDFATEAKARRAIDGQDGDSLIEWLDIRPEYEVLNRHRELLPSGLARELRELTSEIDVIEPIRHTVMHGRPLRPQDPERLFSALTKYAQPHWRELRQVVSMLLQDPTWTPEETLPELSQERIRHNLPLPDYDETGILGRDEDIERIVAALKRRRDSVVTLTGEGGIGKTALALEVAYRLLDDRSAPFEMILWVSLKTERLSVYGIEEVVGAADSLLGATMILGDAAGIRDFSGGIAQLATALSDVPTLICFDNLETISGDDFLLLYEGLPPTVTFLVTSRQGIGQIERRYPIRSLTPKDAMQLLNQLIRTRQADALKSISGAVRAEVAERLRYSPLAIRWYVLSVEAGRDPLRIIQDQSELIHYCVASVYEQLSPGARHCLHAMHLIARPVLPDDLVILTGSPVQEIHDSLQELIRGSLVTHTTSEDLRTSLQVSETAGSFLDSHIGGDDPLRTSIEQIERELILFEGRRQAEEGLRSLAPVVIRTRDSADRPVAFILREALLESQKGDLDAALRKIDDARQLSPDYWEVWRVEAFILSSANAPLAGARYRRAYELAETPDHRAVVAHFWSGHLARNEHDLDEAVRFAREAHEALVTPDTARALGNLLIWQGDYGGGLASLHWALELSDRSGKAFLITITAIVEAYRRMAENAISEESNPLAAWQACWTGWNLGIREIDRGVSDARLLEALLDVAKMGVRSARLAHQNGIEVKGGAALLRGIERRSKRFLARVRRVQYLVNELQAVDPRGELALPAKLLLSELGNAFDDGQVGKTAGSSDYENADWLVGRLVVVRSDRGYGFIAHPDFPDNVFFHVSTVWGSVRFSDLAVGDELEWVHEVDELGRHRAVAVRLPGSSMPLVTGTSRGPMQDGVLSSSRPLTAEVHVTGKPPLNYCFATSDESPPRTILVHQDCFADPEAFDRLDLGDRFHVEIRENDAGDWRAVSAQDVVALMEQSA